MGPKLRTRSKLDSMEHSNALNGEIASRHSPEAIDVNPNGPPFRRAELVAVWLFWGFIAGLTTLNTVLNDMLSPQTRLPLMAPLAAAIIDVVIWGLLTPLIFRATRRYPLDHSHWWWNLAALLGIGLVIAVAQTHFMQWVRYREALAFLHRLPNPNLTGGFVPERSLKRFWFLQEYTAYLIVLAAGYAYDNFHRFRDRQREALALEAQAANLRLELADARLEALRSQLNPHFLFNTLNAVSALVEQNPRGARRTLALLSDLLRETLAARELEVPLADELVFLRRYIELMQIRFQGRLRVIESIDPDTLNARLPNLLLQPLLENAIKHGVEKLEGDGRIEIHAQRRDNELILRVVDNGGILTRREPMEDGGVGLRNTHARLQQAYGARHSFLLRQQNGWTIAEVILPYRVDSGREVA